MLQANLPVVMSFSHTASFQIITQHLLLIMKLDFILGCTTSSYNLKLPIYINLHFTFCLFTFFFFILFGQLSPCLIVISLFLNCLLLLLSVPGSPFCTSCLAIGHSAFYYINHRYIFTECTNIPQHSMKLVSPELLAWLLLYSVLWYGAFTIPALLV